jgi:hypothetical protein
MQDILVLQTLQLAGYKWVHRTTETRAWIETANLALTALLLIPSLFEIHSTTNPYISTLYNTLPPLPVKVGWQPASNQHKSNWYEQTENNIALHNQYSPV